jgi:hypothetical protein
MSKQFKPNPELQHKTDVVLGMIPPVGGVLTYQALRVRLNEPVGSQHPALRAALDRAMDDGMVFENLPGEGYRRLSDGEKVDIGGTKHRLKVLRGAKRWINTIKAVRDWASLTGEQRVTAYAHIAVAETIKTTTHGNSINARVAKTQEPSALDREMERLRSGVTS